MEKFYFTFFVFVSLQVSYLSGSHHFGHTLEEQKSWHLLNRDYSLCAFGVYQTPIHIESHRVEALVLPALDFSGYHNFLPAPISLINNGHTVKLIPGQYTPHGIYKQPSVSGGLLRAQYLMENLHFHWGRENDKGSEHVLNHFRYPMEMHIVHRNINYESLTEAVKHKDGLVVLGFFFQLQVKDNRRYHPILRQLRHVTREDSNTTLDRSFSLASLLPRRTEEFFTYEGSLSTPPCAEAVTWFIFPNPIPISFAQMQLLRQVAIHDNYRKLQPVGQRKIFLRQLSIATPHFTEFTEANISSRLFWLRA